MHYNSYQKNIAFRNSRGSVLGYITPWNTKGYEVAQTFSGAKIDMISPVWFQVTPSYSITGHKDKDWLKKLSKNTKILPSVSFDQWTTNDYKNLFRDTHGLTKRLLDLSQDFDGLVLEFWAQLGGQSRVQSRQLVIDIGRFFKRVGKMLILVIPPPFYLNDDQHMIDKEDLDRMSDYVTFFSLTTYDFSRMSRPGPNAPLKWVRKCIEVLDPDEHHRSQILLGLNFFGYDFTSEGPKLLVNILYDF